MIARYKPGDLTHPTPSLPPWQQRQPVSPTGRRFLWIFSVVMVLTAGTAFIFKLVEFTLTFTTNASVRFAIIPLLTYLIVASGFACLFVWSYLKGHYKDVEFAKYRMLQMQDQIDRGEYRAPARAGEPAAGHEKG